MNARFAQRTVRWVMMIGSPLVRGAWIETARMTARWLDRINPDEETLAVVRPGLAGVLRRTLATSHPIESALAVTRRVTARVTRWRDGEMRRRWCVAGLSRAESKFRRVKGHRAMPALIKALEESTRARRSGIERGVA